MKKIMKKFQLVIAMFFVIVCIVILNTGYTNNDGMQTKEGGIRGSVYTEVITKNGKRKQIYLPGIKVSIQDETGTLKDEVLTKIDGNYCTKKLKPGKYKIGLSKEGYVVSSYDFNIVYSDNYPGPLKINLGTKDYIWGVVLLKDGRAGYYNQKVYDIDIHTQIHVETNVSMQSVCNTEGYYVLAGIHPADKGRITATCQQAEVSASLNGQNQIDLTFANSSPRIQSVVAYNDSGRALLRCRAGNKVQLAADVTTDSKNKLHYKWIPSGNFPGFKSKDTAEIQWQLPSVNGRYEMSLFVFDSLGGVDYRNYDIVGGDGTVNFSGTVSNMGGVAKIANAIITVNGKYKTKTDKQGYFNFKVPENGEERYVLNVVSPGFSLCSKIFSNDAIDKVYELVGTTTEIFDPALDISITERPDKYTKFNEAKSKRSPAHLLIPHNSIVDSVGAVVTVPVFVSLRSVDIAKASSQMPGNLGGVRDGKNVRLESFAAVDVQIRNKSNPSIKYNLANTARAELSLPVSSSQLKKSPKSISLYDYNESTGLWENIGIANKSGNFYKGITNRFSFLSADLEFNTGTYIVLLNNPANSVTTIPDPVSIKLFVPQATGGIIQTYEIESNIQSHDLTNGFPIVNLPSNTTITIQVIRNGIHPIVINTLNVQTGPVIPGSASIPPHMPGPVYDLTAVKLNMLPNGGPFDFHTTDFLTLEQNAPLEQNVAFECDNYYQAIGAYGYTCATNPIPHTITFNEWKDKNGYVNCRDCGVPNAIHPDDGTGDINAKYLNAGDLGFWRDMHQKTFNGTSSFYVTNFTNDVDAINKTNALATVCMEYSPIVPGGVNVTKFYVFDTNNGFLLRSVQLDQNPAKFVPGLCINCHGGAILSYTNDYPHPADLQNYFNNPANTPDMPNFLPFDAKSFWYSTATGYTRNNQEENIRKLNNAVLSVQKTQAIRDFINASYANQPAVPGQAFIDNAVVSPAGTAAEDSWNNNTPENYNHVSAANDIVPSQFYLDVVAPSCRSCHIARSTNPGIWWDTKTKFIQYLGSMTGDVCDYASTRHMPHAQLTYQKFWQSEAPHRPEEMRKFLAQRGFDIFNCDQ